MKKLVIIAVLVAVAGWFLWQSRYYMVRMDRYSSSSVDYHLDDLKIHLIPDIGIVISSENWYIEDTWFEEGRPIVEVTDYWDHARWPFDRRGVYSWSSQSGLVLLAELSADQLEDGIRLSRTADVWGSMYPRFRSLPEIFEAMDLSWDELSQRVDRSGSRFDDSIAVASDPSAAIVMYSDGDLTIYFLPECGVLIMQDRYRLDLDGASRIQRGDRLLLTDGTSASPVYFDDRGVLAWSPQYGIEFVEFLSFEQLDRAAGLFRSSAYDRRDYDRPSLTALFDEMGLDWYLIRQEAKDLIDDMPPDKEMGDF